MDPCYRLTQKHKLGFEREGFFCLLLPLIMPVLVDIIAVEKITNLKNNYFGHF